MKHQRRDDYPALRLLRAIFSIPAKDTRQPQTGKRRRAVEDKPVRAKDTTRRPRQPPSRTSTRRRLHDSQPPSDTSRTAGP